MSRARSRCSQVFIEMSKRVDGGRDGAPCDYIGAVRSMRLRRRRSRVPWIYLVYHAAPGGRHAGDGGRTSSSAPPLDARASSAAPVPACVAALMMPDG